MGREWGGGGGGRVRGGGGGMHSTHNAVQLYVLVETFPGFRVRFDKP